MAFEPIVFTRTIPPTVATQAPALGVVSFVSQVSSSNTTPSNTSMAVSLVTQLGDLIDTANYLQTLILGLNPGLGISIDPESDPDLARALAQIYNGQVPPAVSLQMYSYQLDAELGSSQVNLAAGSSSPVQANPFQTQALITANKAFESQVGSSGVFAAQSSLLLRGLKGSVITNATIQQQLMQYPAATTTTPSTPSVDVIPAATIDVSPAVASLVQNNINSSGQAMSSMYQVLAQPDPIASDVANVVAALATVAVPDLIRMNGLLQMTQQGDLSNSMQDLSGGISTYTLPQMLSQASGMMFQLDRVIQMVSSATNSSNAVGKATQDVQGASTAPGMLVGVVRSMKVSPTTQTSGPLAGMPLNSGALTKLAVSSPMPPALSNVGLSPGLNEISSLMTFSTANAQKSNDLQQDAFQRLSGRVNGNMGSMAQTLGVVSSISSLTSLVTSFISAQKSGSSIAGQSPTTQLSTVSSILASSQTGNGTQYTVQSGVVTLTPPAAPAPTPGAAAVFASSGIQTSLQGLTQNL